VLEDITIEIPDSADTYTSSNFLDLDVDIYAYANDGTYAGAIRKFLFVVIGAKKVYDILYLTLRDRFAHDELEALYPTSEMVQDVWASDGDSKLGYCMPIPFGAAFIPMPSIYITDQRYYLLGEPDGTYTIKKVQSPQDWPKSVWESGGYTFTQYTKDTYRVFQAIIADSDADGIADANGLFPDGSKFEPISVEYTRSDTATITNPANIIANLIFSGSGVTIDPAFYRNDTIFEGAFTHPRPRYEWASEILKACNAAMVIGANGHRQIKNLVPTAYGQLTTANILSDSFNFDPIVSSDNYDGGYVQFPKAGDPQHVLYKHRVGLGNSASVNPSPDTLNLQFINDTQEAQKFGILYFERLVDKSADVQAEAWLDMMELNPDAVLGISGALYDSAVNADMVIDSLSISSDMTVSIKGEQFGHSLSIFNNLTPSALSIAEDDSTGGWRPVIVGPDGDDSKGIGTNAVVGSIRSQNYDATNGMKIDFDNAKIIVNEAGGITINSDDGITLSPGADIYIKSEASNSGTIYFLTASGEYVQFSANYNDGILFIAPKTYDTSGLWVGYSDAGTTDMRFRRIVTSSHSLDMFVADRSGSSGWIRLSNADNTSVNTPSTELWVNPDAVQIEDWSGTTGYGGRLNCDNDAYFAKDVSALTFTDRTPAFEGDALSELKKIKGKNGKIDHATLPKMAQRETKERIYTKDEKGNKIKDKDGKPIYEDIKVPGRDLGAMISILTVAVQQLTDKVEALEAKWSQKT
jgi:hypothetical protein